MPLTQEHMKPRDTVRRRVPISNTQTSVVGSNLEPELDAGTFCSFFFVLFG